MGKVAKEFDVNITKCKTDIPTTSISLDQGGGPRISMPIYRIFTPDIVLKKYWDV